MKKSTTKIWKECLTRGEWEKIGQTEDIEDMAKDFTGIVTKALDECAPITTENEDRETTGAK